MSAEVEQLSIPATTMTDTTTAKTAEKATESGTDNNAKETDGKSSNTGHQRNSQRGGKGGGKSRRHNNRSNYESLPESNDADDIRRQVEFYFSDSNLPIDAYLLKLTGGPENNAVPLKTIHSFKRMRHYQPYSDVRAAVKESELLELDEKDEITRKTPLDARYTLEVNDNKRIAQEIGLPRSVYAKGFGYEYPTSQLDIETYFEPYGPVNSVRMRRGDDGGFKGSVFVEFADEKLAEQFLALDSHPTFVQHGKKTDDKTPPSAYKLTIMSKKGYLDSKGVDAEQEANSSNNRKPNNRQRGNKTGRGRPSSNGKVHKDDSKTRRNLDQHDTNSERKRKEYHDVNVEDDEHTPEQTTEGSAAGPNNKRSLDADTETEPPAKKVKSDGDA